MKGARECEQRSPQLRITFYDTKLLVKGGAVLATARV